MSEADRIRSAIHRQQAAISPAMGRVADQLAARVRGQLDLMEILGHPDLTEIDARTRGTEDPS